MTMANDFDLWARWLETAGPRDVPPGLVERPRPRRGRTDSGGVVLSSPDHRRGRPSIGPHLDAAKAPCAAAAWSWWRWRGRSSWSGRACAAHIGPVARQVTPRATS